MKGERGLTPRLGGAYALLKSCEHVCCGGVGIILVYG